jgi:peptidoglycan/xylan/chitin deacetylase (PgdA/CDA1 family)
MGIRSSSSSRRGAEHLTFPSLPRNAHTSDGVYVGIQIALFALFAASILLPRGDANVIGRFRIPAVGFVNEAKLEGATGEEVAARVGLLRKWLAAGLELGNHTYSHRDLNRIPREQFEADVIRGEAVTRQLMKAHNQSLRYFRHPFLHVGADLHDRRGFEAFLARHGYIVAPVTIDNDDFVYAAAYARALRRGDSPGAMRIGDDYVRYMAEVFSYFERVSRRVTGREIPQILLLHANSLNADRFATLAELLVRRGYRFVSLAEALKDAAYRLPDDFVGAPSNSWFNHWEITAGRQPVPTPAPPAWIQGLTRATP